MPFPKGNKLGGRHKGSKNKKTLLMEERRAIFEHQVSQEWENTIRKLPPTYIADQFMGKAPEKIEHSGEIKTTSLPLEAIAIIEEDLRKKKVENDEL